MRDLRNLPIGEMLIVVLAAAVAATFAGVFVTKGRGSEAAQETAAVASPTPGAETVPGGLAVEMGDNFFVFQGQRQPNIPTPAGKDVSVNLVNNGKAIHNMRIASLDDRYDTSDDFVSNPDTMRAGAKGTLTFKIDRAGTFKFRCDFHPDEMTGTITVQ